ncbi:hypothetical protein BZA05DRAFT_149373 [Tricharina praecox]|uniref:uncharacterized protein n=1 Tax=Tricharina praecox TaxID=43433 RepID=UPI00221F4599|nr:uncharacterized protein BZA05DRAFT_149373 [Tricharina praecox]KAI5845389.1 hypothetical protein BZA05DRAFT_149373 [Tricharina praecox]
MYLSFNGEGSVGRWRWIWGGGLVDGVGCVGVSVCYFVLMRNSVSVSVFVQQSIIVHTHKHIRYSKVFNLVIIIVRHRFTFFSFLLFLSFFSWASFPLCLRLCLRLARLGMCGGGGGGGGGGVHVFLVGRWFICFLFSLLFSVSFSFVQFRSIFFTFLMPSGWLLDTT